MGLRIEKRQRRAPRAAEHDPFRDAEFAAQPVDIGDEMGRRVVADLAERRRTTAAALIEYDDAPEGRIEKPAVHRCSAGARTAMQEQYRRTLPIARLLPIHRMARVEPELAGAVRLDRRGEDGAGGSFSSFL